MAEVNGPVTQTNKPSNIWKMSDAEISAWEKAPKEGTAVASSIATGKEKGTQAALDLYGVSKPEISSGVTDVLSRRKAATEGKDPATSSLLNRKNEQVRQAKARGMSEDQVSQIERQANVDVGQQEFLNQEQSLSKYQSLLGNILGGTSALEQSYAGLELGGQPVAVPEQSGGALGTIICTELFLQGYMNSEIYKKDGEYGANVRRNDPFVYDGYIIMASPVVQMMKRSPKFTKLISYPALCWAKDMAGERNFIGKIINKIGTPICRIVGKAFVLKRSGYAKA